MNKSAELCESYIGDKLYKKYHKSPLKVAVVNRRQFFFWYGKI
jgi:hypothetical protein